MFRRPFLPRVCLTLAFGATVLVVPLAARSQDAGTEERLDRLERDLNMLQRQVYRGLPPPAAAAEGGDAVNVEVRMERLEQQMRDLTGRVEEVINRVEQVRQRVEQINGDVGTRLGSAPAGAPAPRSGPVANEAPGFPPPPGGPDDALTPPRRLAGPSSPAAAPPPTEGSGGPEPIFGTLTPPGARSSPALASAAPAGRPPTGGTLPGGSATEQYNRAFGLLRKADYPAAEAALKAFVERHPRDPMAGNAQFWLGETYYARSRYLEAASAFAEGYKRYPRSPKAPDDLLKLAMSLGRANQKQNACLALAQLDHDFPHPGAPIKTHAATERRHLGC